MEIKISRRICIADSRQLGFFEQFNYVDGLSATSNLNLFVENYIVLECSVIGWIRVS